MEEVQKIEEFIKAARKKWLTLSLSLMGMAIIAVLISRFIDKEGILIPPTYLDYFAYFSILVFLPGGYFFYGKRCKDKAETTTDLGDKLLLFENGLKIKYIFFSVASVLLGITTVFAKHESALYMLGIALVILFVNKPTKAIFKEDCKYTEEIESYEEEINNDDSIEASENQPDNTDLK